MSVPSSGTGDPILHEGDFVAPTSASSKAKEICTVLDDEMPVYELPERSSLRFSDGFGLHPRELYLSVTLPKELSRLPIHAEETVGRVMVTWQYQGSQHHIDLGDQVADPQHPTSLNPEADSHGNPLTIFIVCDAEAKEFDYGGRMQEIGSLQSYIEHIACGEETYLVAADVKTIRIILKRLEIHGFYGTCVNARNFLAGISGRCTVVSVPSWNASKHDLNQSDMANMCSALGDILKQWGDVRRFEILETAIDGVKVEDCNSVRVPKGPTRLQMANNPTLTMLVMYIEFHQPVTAEQVVRAYPEPYRFGDNFRFQAMFDHAGPIRSDATEIYCDSSEELINLDKANQPLPAGHFSATMREFQYVQDMGNNIWNQDQGEPSCGNGGPSDSDYRSSPEGQSSLSRPESQTESKRSGKYGDIVLLPLLNKSTRIGRNFNNHDKKNQVIIQNVASGEDIRTTVMLRNIPNKITQPQIQSILEWTSFGKFDFLYLRIDFANNCNTSVGYAFINFVKPECIIDFVQQVRGQKWWNSEKIAEVCYATIQGIECLVAKFRNSSVMLEEPCYRPKLFATYEEENTGQEKPFPGPDNFHKLARSNQNAAQIGLFSPLRGSRGRSSDRSRNRRFDKGNSYSMMEDLASDYSWFCMATGTTPVEAPPYDFGSVGEDPFE